MRGVSQTLSGRIAVLTLDPFSTSEVREKNGPENLDELLAAVFDKGIQQGVSQTVELVD